MAKKENKIFVYILEDGRLYGREIKEKELENYVYYRKDDLVFINKDYDKVKPLVRKLLQKQSILKDWGKLNFLILVGLLVFVGFIWLMLNLSLNQIDKKVDNLSVMLSGSNGNRKDGKEIIIKNGILTGNLDNKVIKNEIAR